MFFSSLSSSLRLGAGSKNSSSEESDKQSVRSLSPFLGDCHGWEEEEELVNLLCLMTSYSTSLIGVGSGSPDSLHLAMRCQTMKETLSSKVSFLAAWITRCFSSSVRGSGGKFGGGKEEFGVKKKTGDCEVADDARQQGGRCGRVMGGTEESEELSEPL